MQLQPVLCQVISVCLLTILYLVMIRSTITWLCNHYESFFNFSTALKSFGKYLFKYHSYLKNMFYEDLGKHLRSDFEQNEEA